MGVIEGTGLGHPLQNAGAPVGGTNAVHTLTFGGTPTGGTFRLGFDGWTTDNITWSATNNTLRDRVDAALEALPNIGSGGVVTAVGTMTAGVGTLTVTFSGAAMAKRGVPVLTVADNSMTGTSPTLAVTETTPGVQATRRDAPKGALLIDTDNGALYQNSGSPGAPTWGLVGSES